jgi:hypothetical protein
MCAIAIHSIPLFIPQMAIFSKDALASIAPFIGAHLPHQKMPSKIGQVF